MSFSFHEHVALFGGSFNPPHVGHVQAAKDILQDPKVANVLVLPSFKTPLKRTEVSFSNRFEMAKLAFPQFEVSRLEEEQKLEYTWQVLSVAQLKYAKLAFVIGTDQFSSLEQWSRFPEVLGMSDWIVLIRRPGRLDDSSESISKLIKSGILTPTSDQNTFQLRQTGKNRVLRFVETNAPNVSSTYIREQFALGNQEQVKSLLPEGVSSFIERNKLYGT